MILLFLTTRLPETKTQLDLQALKLNHLVQAHVAQYVSDKAHGSAVMSFINMGLTTIVVLSLGLLTIKMLLLPGIYLLICITAALLIKFAIKEDNL